MEKTKWPALSGLVAGTFFLTRSTPTTFAFDHPLLSAVVFLASTGATVIGAERFFLQHDGRTIRGHQYAEVSLHEVGEPHSSRQPSPSPEDVTYASSPRKLRIPFLTLVCAILARVEIFVRIMGNTQCSGISWEPLIPFTCACYDYWRIHRHQRQTPQFDDPNGSAYDALQHHLVRTQYKYVLTAGIVSVGGMIAIAASRSPGSTYICAASLSLHWLTPLLQRLGTILDVVIVLCIVQILHNEEGRSTSRVASRSASVGWALLQAAQISALLLTVVAAIYYLAFAPGAERRTWRGVPSVYMWSLFKLNVILCVTVLCAILSIANLGLTTVTLLVAFVSICTTTISNSWTNAFAFPPIHSGLSFFALSLAVFGFAAYFYVDTISDGKTHHSTPYLFDKVPRWFYLALLAMLFVQTGIWAAHSNHVNYHPIDLLMYDAEIVHETFRNQSATSKTLSEAVSQYKDRYLRDPPPGFQHWYEFAVARNSTIIDDFDSINRDLLPFFALSPKEIRHRTWQMTSNRWNDASGLMIRNHRIEIGPNVMDTHRWMLEGVIRMMQPFEQYLPDMDLAFNVNDEPRVVVPYADIRQMRINAEMFPQISAGRNEFSPGRAEQWTPVSENTDQERLLMELSWQPTFYEFGSAGCRAGSAARDERLWDVQRFCSSCTQPHSIGAFLSDWKLAGDICHQPDMASSHGLYISPSSFKGSHKLYPIFSQSKAYGFNDILYPSAWNYMDKSKYEPNDEYPDRSYANKNSTIFWRGATSEGFSHDFGHWKGMMRQRYVHMANKIDGPQATQSILLPRSDSKDAPKFTYASVQTSDLTELLPTDVRIVNEINRCGGIDCPQQEREFAPLAAHTDFQSHWQYKFLLDLDGAGFSGRFLPFLYSHSLPFKAALYREWWDDRLTAWHHFVPLDVRGQGFWATLAYFAGLKGKVNGRKVELEAHDMQGEMIAENGRKWANTVLRKEDMEIYMFRLLLEWGRLTDDNRESLGFTLDSG